MDESKWTEKAAELRKHAYGHTDEDRRRMLLMLAEDCELIAEELRAKSEHQH